MTNSQWPMTETLALLAGPGRPTGQCLCGSWSPLSRGRPVMTLVIGHWVLVIAHWSRTILCQLPCGDGFGSEFLFPFGLRDLISALACLPADSLPAPDAEEHDTMPLTHTRDLFAKALKGKYALGAFNVNNMELLQAIVEACEEEKAPVMLQISKGARQYANPVYLKKLIEAAVSLSNIPIAVHLDHGDTFELCKECIDEGFTSVMIDGSHLPFDKNVEICKKVVDYAHKHNCVVEGELGELVGAQFDEGEEGGGYSAGGHYTHPDEAVQFVKQTGIDSLADRK